MSATPRVVYLAHSVSAHGGGMERMGRALIEAAANDVHFTVIASEGLEDLPASVTVVHVALPRRPAVARILWFYLRSGPLVRRARASADVVQACGAITTAKVDLVTVHLCQAAVPKLPRTRPLWRSLNARAARGAGRWLERRRYRVGEVGELVAVSASVSRELAAAYPRINRREIRNGVDVAHFDQGPRSVRAEGPFTVLMVSGDHVTKGVDLAIEALVFAPSVHLRVVGRGDTSDLVERARALGVADRVQFLGEQVDVRAWYRSSDVVLCASRYESFGLYMVEGALAGCAVVAPDVGVASELVGDSAGGLIVSRDPREMGSALEGLAGDPGLVLAMGERARRRAQEFTVAAMADAYIALYNARVTR